MSTSEFSGEEILTARKEVRSQLGKGFETKASDAFCVTFHARRSRPESVSAGVMEAMGLPVVPAISTAHTPTVIGFGDAIGTPEIATKQGESFGEIRQLLIHEFRRRAYSAMTPVYTELDRQSHTTLGFVPEVLRASAAPIVQLCWLNRTIRTWAEPEAIAAVAEDSAVTDIDVSRRIMPDVNFGYSINHQAIGHPATDGLAFGATGRGVTVAVIDSEVHVGHPALAPRVIPRRNYTSEPWGTPDTHGTAIAGIIGADFANQMGLAPEAMIYNYKVMATNPLANGDDFDGARAVQDAVEDGVDIINCSWGTGPASLPPSREAAAITNAVTVFGVAVVKSAGNRGPGAGTLTSPAEAQGVIVVGATDIDGKAVEGYSSRGPAGGKIGPDIVAPGGDPTTSLACCLVNGGFGSAGYGTSYAAPHATGALALISENSETAAIGLRMQILSAATPLQGWNTDSQGQGLLRLA
jgi:serine protease AprX